jgi:hypothetical protein
MPSLTQCNRFALVTLRIIACRVAYELMLSQRLGMLKGGAILHARCLLDKLFFSINEDYAIQKID